MIAAPHLRLVKLAPPEPVERPRRWLVAVVTDKGSVGYTATGTRSEVWDAALESWGDKARISIKPQEAA